MVPVAQLQRIASSASSAWAGQHAVALNETMAACEVTTPVRQAAFLAHALIGGGDACSIQALGAAWNDLDLNRLADEHAFLRICRLLVHNGTGLALQYWDRAVHVLGARQDTPPTFGETKCPS